MSQKKILSVLLTLSMLLSLLPAVTLPASAISTGITADYAWYTDGPSEEDGFYHIGTPADLAGLANLVNFTDSAASGQSAAVPFSGETVVLDRDIDLNSGVTFTFDGDTGLVAVTDGIDTFYLGTGVKGNTDGGNTVFDGTASIAGTVYTDDAGTTGDAPFALNTWVPVGSDSAVFSGTFDGGSHTVSGVYINSFSLNYQGLFGYGEDSTIQNVNLDDGFLCGANKVGGIAGCLNRGKVSSCTNGCTVIGCGEISGTNVYANLGGVVGYAYDSGTVSDCRNTGVINNTALFAAPVSYIQTNIGGVVGKITRVGDFVVSGCTNTGSISTDGNNVNRTVYAGGVFGYISGDGTPVSDCSNSGSITGSGSFRTYVGGVAGYVYTKVSLSNCTNTGDVTGSSGIFAYAGGVAGYVYQNCSVSGSSNTGNITSTATCAYAGGIAASAIATSISDSNNEGPVSATGTAEAMAMAPPRVSTTGASNYVGGIAGLFYYDGTASNCRNSGEVSGAIVASDILDGATYIGGVVGYNDNMVINSVNTANVTATNTGTAAGFVTICMGGVAGNNSGTVSNSYNTGNITNTGTNILEADLGGVTGRTNQLLKNCYNTGGVSGNAAEAFVGGVAGFQMPSTTSELSDCYWLSGAAQTVNGTARMEKYAVGGYYYSGYLAAGTDDYTANFSNSHITDCYSFDGSGTTWTLSGGAYDITPAGGGSAISLEGNASLVDALNTWVDTDDYYMWASDRDSAPVNGGYPVQSVVYKPTLSGTPTIAVTNGYGESADRIKIGATLTATANAAPDTNLSYQWQVSSNGSVWGNATGTGSRTAVYSVDGADARKYLRVMVTSSDAYGAVYSASTAQVPYLITLTASGNTETDAVSFSDSASETAVYAASGEVCLSYTLDSSGTEANALSFSGGTITKVTSPGTGGVTYSVDGTDASDGVIAITASFVHTNVSHTIKTTPSPAVPILVNDRSWNAGTSKTTTINGKTETTITVDADQLEEILDSEEDGATVIIPFSNDPDRASGIFTGQMVKNLANQEAILMVQTDSASYILPASELDIDAVAEQFGENISLSDLEVTVTIAAPSDDTVEVIENAAEDGGFSIMVPPVAFTVTCTYNGQTVEVDSYNAYVKRTIAIPDDVDPDKITTAVVTEADGTQRHVPTEITLIDGAYYAVINSLTNSVYTLIYHPVEFADVDGRWAQNAIIDMAARKVITGYEDGTFRPDSDITRAEFAALVVRALGLPEGVGEANYSDVADSDWCCGYIQTASAYGIIMGCADGTFRPNEKLPASRP